MAPRHVGSDSTRRDRFGDNPPLLLVGPPPAADDRRNLCAAPNQLRVVINVDHSAHTIHDPKRIASMHAPIGSAMWGESTAYTSRGHAVHQEGLQNCFA